MSRTDAALIARSARGDHAAFGELVLRYQDRLYNTVYRLLDNAEDAQDVVQDAFLNAYQSVCQAEAREGSAFRGDAQFFTWLYRIAVNQAISLKRKRRLVLTGDARLNGRVVIEPLDESEQTRPGRALERAEDERTVQEALNRLSPDHRAVVVLKELQGEKYETIAEILEVPIGTVRSRLHRARLELRDLLPDDAD